MLEWMLYAVFVSLSAGVAAAAAERALRLHGRAARAVWLSALVASLGLPALAWVSGGTAAAAVRLPPLGVGEAVYTVGGHVTGAGGASSWITAEPALRALWIASSGAALLWFGISLVRLRRTLGGLPSRAVGGVEVYLTDHAGPAAWTSPAGRARVLLPEWLRALGPDLRRLALSHEREHLRRGDSLLVSGGYLLVALAPWNLPLWWQLKRLRRATEIDCDARVLRAGAGRREYGHLLLAVGSHGAGSGLTALALSERTSELKARIRNMTHQPTDRRQLRTATLSLLAVGALVLACETSPPEPGDRARESSAAEQTGQPGASLTSEDGPASIPYDVPPKLQNPNEVRSRLQELYPESLKAEGVGAKVVLWLHVDRKGRVAKTRIAEPSEHDALNRAARGVAEAMRFDPARRQDEPTAVWVQQAILFRAKGPSASAEEGLPTAGSEPDPKLDLSPDGSSPVVYVDGERVDAKRLRTLDTGDIERIEVQKPEGGAGIVEIVTRGGGA